MSIETKHKLEPAYSIIEKLGGKTAVASALDVAPSTLSRWCTPSPEGTGGTVPVRHWQALQKLARQRGVSLPLSELAKRGAA